MKKREPRLVWVILVALSVLTAAALTSALATAQEEAVGSAVVAPVEGSAGDLQHVPGAVTD